MAQVNNTFRSLLLCVVLLSSILIVPAAQARDALTDATSTGEQVILNVPAASPDPYGRETPRSLATGLLDAFASGDYNRASQFLEPFANQKKPDPEAGVALAKQLQQILDSSGSMLPFVGLSNESTGVTDDELPVDQERLGSFRTKSGESALLAKRVTPADAGVTPYWVITAESLELLAQGNPVSEQSVSATLLPTVLTDIKIFGASVADWLLLIVIAAVAFLGIRFIFAILLRMIRAYVNDPETNRLYQFSEAAIPPLSLCLAVILFFIGTQELQVGIVARQVLARYATIVAWVALVWLLWRLIDMISDLWSARMAHSDRYYAISAMVFLRRSAKSLLGFAAFVAVLDTLDIDVTTSIAALGIGGLAVALGAQKSIENLVGTLTVIVDQPVRDGDFCKVGDVLGTVEDIGMRSSRIRTLARTVVTIPNGDFASQQIENYSRRDSFLFNPIVGLTYDTSAAQMRSVLAAIRALLTEDTNIIDDSRVRFVEFNASSLDIEIFAYVRTFDYATFLGMREEILLKIMETIEAEGVNIAFPTQTVMLKTSKSSRSAKNDDITEQET